MLNESATERTGFEQFRREFAEGWRQLPYKGSFLLLLASWLALFQFLGNSTLGYVNTPSLFGWLNWVLSKKDDDQHGPWILVGVLAILWWKRRTLLELPKRNWWPGLVVIFAAILIHAVGYTVFQQTRISVVGFFVGIYGIIGLVWGPKMLRETFFPFFLFSFCLPLGGTLGDSMTLPLRMLATKITTTWCHVVFGINVIQDGVRMFDANHTYTYEVAAACSGIRSLTATLILALVYAFMMFKSPWRRLVMVAATIPLAVAANVVRLTTIILASETFGQSAGNYVHESWWTSLAPYIPMIGGILLIGRWLREKRSASVTPKPDQASWTNRDLALVVGPLIALFIIRDQIPAIKAWTSTHQYTSVWTLVALAITALYFVSRKSEASVPAPNPEFPHQLRANYGSGSIVLMVLALVLITGTSVGLHHLQGHQKLGAPGVKVVQSPVYDPAGNLAGTNSVALPDHVLDYKSKAVPIDPVVLNWLPKDTTYGQRLYSAPDGFETQMNVVLMGADRTSIHKPQYCLEGFGWHITRSEVDQIPFQTPRAYNLPVNKLILNATKTAENGVTQNVGGVYVYWFVCENRLTVDHGQRMFDMGLEMLRTGVMQRWAYVSCFAVCYPGQEESAYRRIKELVTAAVPQFQLTTGEPLALARNP